MILDEKVLTALEVLTDAAENDFELHRICTLIRDLVAPPKVEIISETHQRFDGVNYTLNKADRRYTIQRHIYRSVWQYYNGEIPEGYDIHHDNLNKADNNISNLVLLPRDEHRKMHLEGIRAARRKKIICTGCGKEYEGVASRGYDLCPACRNPEKICPVCGKKYTHNVVQGKNFCSRSCFIKFRNSESRIKKNCNVCGKEFVASVSNQKYCSRECAFASRRETRTCPICGKTFETQKNNYRQKCCSRSCGFKYRSQNRRKN